MTMTIKNPRPKKGPMGHLLDARAAMGRVQIAALRWCESLVHAGQTDWRLPNAKELHSIVDYSRSPDTTGTAAILMAWVGTRKK